MLTLKGLTYVVGYGVNRSMCRGKYYLNKMVKIKLDENYNVYHRLLQLGIKNFLQNISKFMLITYNQNVIFKSLYEIFLFNISTSEINIKEIERNLDYFSKICENPESLSHKIIPMFHELLNYYTVNGGNQKNYESCLNVVIDRFSY
jgi:hypothetical protein